MKSKHVLIVKFFVQTFLKYPTKNMRIYKKKAFLTNFVIFYKKGHIKKNFWGHFLKNRHKNKMTKKTKTGTFKKTGIRGVHYILSYVVILKNFCKPVILS